MAFVAREMERRGFTTPLLIGGAVILEQIRLMGGVRVSELTDVLGVSDMTVRRDLETLASRGMLEKVHGGATAIPQHSTDEPGFEAKSSLEQPEKEGIAGRAAAMVRPGTAIAISAGTTTWALARLLGDVPQLTVVTNSIPVAEILYRIGRHGMDLRRGFTTPNLMEADTNRALMEAARKVVVVADHTKWGVVGLSSIAALSEADILITDDQLSPEVHDVLAEHVGELIVAPAVRSTEAIG